MAETKGDFFRKKIKELENEDKEKPKKGEKKKVVPKGPIKGSDNMQDFDRSLKNLKKDFRFPKRKKRMPEGTGPIGTDIPEPKEPRKPGEEKIMTPLARGGRAMLRGGGICKRGMNKKAVGKNS